MMGNASEWVDSCELDDAGRARATSAITSAGRTTSYEDCFGDDNDRRDFDYYPSYALGFRCCSP